MRKSFSLPFAAIAFVLSSCGLNQEKKMAEEVCACMQPTEALISAPVREALLGIPAKDMSSVQLQQAIEAILQQSETVEEDRELARQIFHEGMLANCLAIAQKNHPDAITLDAIESLRNMTTSLEASPCKLSALAFRLRWKQLEEAD
jgi:hypothetical protein